MSKVFKEFALFVLLILSVWFALSKIDWVTILKLDQKSEKLEANLGDWIWKTMQNTSEIVDKKETVTPIDSMIQMLTVANHFESDQIKLHVVKNDVVNAFALPNGHLVVYTGLINACEKKEELIGVLGHEMAHIHKRHVMDKLVKEVGLSVLISFSSGGGNPELGRRLVSELTSKAYDRRLESEADRLSVDYMIKAGVDPQPFADFLYRLSTKEGQLPDQFYWISTHPESKERAQKLTAYIKTVAPRDQIHR